MPKNLTVRLDDDLAADTEALARAEGQSLNETVKSALREAVDRRRRDPKFKARLARSHPLPDGNKRAAWVAVRMCVETNGWPWQPRPTVDEAENAVLAVAAGGWGEERTAGWLGEHLAERA